MLIQEVSSTHTLLTMTMKAKVAKVAMIPNNLLDGECHQAIASFPPECAICPLTQFAETSVLPKSTTCNTVHQAVARDLRLSGS